MSGNLLANQRLAPSASLESGTIHQKILLARNKIKLQHKTYLYEGMKNIILEKEFTVSEFMFGCIVMAIEAMSKRKLEYITDKDRLILRNLRRATSYSPGPLAKTRSL